MAFVKDIEPNAITYFLQDMQMDKNDVAYVKYSFDGIQILSVRAVTTSLGQGHIGVM